MRWLSQFGLALTRLGNSITGGLAEESMSSRAWRADGNRKWWGRSERAYKSDRNKPALPLIGGARE